MTDKERLDYLFMLLNSVFKYDRANVDAIITEIGKILRVNPLKTVKEV
jgi:hypothetical protein